MLRADARKITWGVLGTLGGVSLIVFALLFLLLADPQGDPLPASARPDHAAIRKELEAAAQVRLGGYGWIDRDKGIVHIPVDRAARLWITERSGK
jgi:hypothetical protein